MATGTLIALYVAWVLAAGAIAIAVAGFVAIVMDFLGIGGARVVFDVVLVAGFLVMIALPFLVRRSTAPDPGE